MVKKKKNIKEAEIYIRETVEVKETSRRRIICFGTLLLVSGSFPIT